MSTAGSCSSLEGHHTRPAPSGQLHEPHTSQIAHLHMHFPGLPRWKISAGIKGQRGCVFASQRELTYVILVVDDGVERNIFPLQVPLGRLHVVGALVALNEAVELTIHKGAVG